MEFAAAEEDCGAAIAAKPPALEVSRFLVFFETWYEGDGGVGVGVGREEGWKGREGGRKGGRREEEGREREWNDIGRRELCGMLSSLN